MIRNKRKDILMNSKTYITVVLGIIVAKIIGFSRDIFFAHQYGTNITSDIYFQIFSVVTLIFTGIGIALQTQVIMNLNKDENATDEAKKAYVSSFICKTIIYLSCITAIMYVFARPFTRLLLPEIGGADFETAVRLTYIMLPSFLFVTVAYIISGVLQNNRVFFIPSIVSLPYNIIIIASLFIPGVSIEQIGITTTIGWFLHIVIQLPHFYKKGFRIIYKANTIKAEKKNKLNMSIWWIFISNMMFQLCFMIDKAFVSGDPGMTSTLNYASNLFVTISSVFVVAMSSVVFPAISKNYEEGNKDYVRELIGYIFIVMFAVFVPFLLVVSLFGEQIIGLVYERGAFTHESTIATSAAFVIYSFGILGYLAQELINKVMYLASKYIYTILGTVIVVAAKLVLNSALIEKSDNGTFVASLTTTILLTLYAAMAFVVLYRIIGNYLSKSVLICISKILISGAVAFAVYCALKLIIPNVVKANSVLFFVPIMICGLVYIGTIIALGVHKQLIRNPKSENKQ